MVHQDFLILAAALKSLLSTTTFLFWFFCPFFLPTTTSGSYVLPFLYIFSNCIRPCAQWSTKREMGVVVRLYTRGVRVLGQNGGGFPLKSKNIPVSNRYNSLIARAKNFVCHTLSNANRLCLEIQHRLTTVSSVVAEEILFNIFYILLQTLLFIDRLPLYMILPLQGEYTALC